MSTALHDSYEFAAGTSVNPFIFVFYTVLLAANVLAWQSPGIEGTALNIAGTAASTLALWWAV